MPPSFSRMLWRNVMKSAKFAIIIEFVASLVPFYVAVSREICGKVKFRQICHFRQFRLSRGICRFLGTLLLS